MSRTTIATATILASLAFASCNRDAAPDKPNTPDRAQTASARPTASAPPTASAVLTASAAPSASAASKPNPLRLETHFYRIAEHQFRLSRFLDAKVTGRWAHEMNLDQGIVRFIDASTHREFLVTRVRLLGTLDPKRRWMWGWGIDIAEKNPKIVAGFDGLRTTAAALGRSEFANTKPFALPGETDGKALAITTAGALGLWTFYALDSQEGVVVFLGLEDCPAVDAEPFDAAARLTFINAMIGVVPIDARAALDAYLGAPLRVESGGGVDYPFHGGTLRVKIDEAGRITKLESQLSPSKP